VLRSSMYFLYCFEQILCSDVEAFDMSFARLIPCSIVSSIAAFSFVCGSFRNVLLATRKHASRSLRDSCMAFNFSVYLICNIHEIIVYKITKLKGCNNNEVSHKI